LFLEEARKISPEGSLDRYCGHWLALQLRPSDVVGIDVFLSLTTILNAASDEYLGVDGLGAARFLRRKFVDYLSAPNPRSEYSSDLYFVLD
jgi:hypothetical protein